VAVLLYACGASAVVTQALGAPDPVSEGHTAVSNATQVNFAQGNLRIVCERV
jgi:hypothetical protein